MRLDTGDFTVVSGMVGVHLSLLFLSASFPLTGRSLRPKTQGTRAFKHLWQGGLPPGPVTDESAHFDFWNRHLSQEDRMDW